VITIATLFWQPNAKSKAFSCCYSEEWVEKLYRGFARNLTEPFRFVCYTDRDRTFAEPIEQVRMRSAEPGYGDCIQPYELNVPMILVGLDTVVTGNCDHLAAYCFTADTIALPRDPYAKHQACNGVALVPAGNGHVWERWDGENDMVWCRQQPHVFIDDLWPGQVHSWKGAVKRQGLGDTRICYFHGAEKMHELPDVGWIAEHWK
jgi:hypothetical protein